MPNNNGKLVEAMQPKSSQQTMQRQVLIDGRLSTLNLTTTTHLETSITKPKVVVHAGLLLDASGSMWGKVPQSSKTKMGVVLDSFQEMCKEVLEDDDRCTVSFFDERYRQVFHNTKVSTLKFQRARLEGEADKLGGVTALYDSTMKVLASMQATKEQKDAHGNTVLNNLVVFTDGGDNSSKDNSLRQMIAALMQPGLSNFHATIIAVGGADAMQEAEGMRTEVAKFKNKTHVQVITADSIVSAFRAANRRAKQVKQELVERIVVDLRQNGKKKAPQPALMALLGPALGVGNGPRMLGPGPQLGQQERGRSASRPKGRPESASRGRPQSASRGRPRSASRSRR
ncbi:hypothetical protein DUNSADRAFT_17263 [Dunaliella salina]|uniref:VWFA domain-containing protein n=1 Tax=Dunaliella salina TaxID=3046 RepID=A0ABQ7H0B8_DUNSA|nr:hypothetical protein DUNSADRAFT_17263 [Dunaliella salina]|eukprot:KAF5840294.1 hypothetical protein DUNSADRAFT_17263 [Dunaliella salina]